MLYWYKKADTDAEGEKDYAEAKALLLRALALDALDLATLNNLAVLHEDCLLDYTEADKYFRRALELAPHDVTSLCNYGGFLQQSMPAHEGENAAAAAILRKATAIDPVMAHELIAAQHRRVGSQKHSSVAERGVASVGVEVSSSTGAKTGTFIYN